MLFAGGVARDGFASADGVEIRRDVDSDKGTDIDSGDTDETEDVYKRQSQLGAITTKGCAAEPWPGNPAPRMTEVRGGMMNSVGLQNPGVEAFARDYGPWLDELTGKGTQVICQVAGHSTEEYVRALEMFDEPVSYTHLIYLLALSLRNTVRMSARGLPLCALFGVAGILGGGKVTNVYADLSYAQFRDVVFGGYASMGDVVPASGMGDVRTAMLVAIVTCLTLLMLLTVWAGVRLLTDVRNERYAAALLASHNEDRSRLESYLAGRGLNSVQVEVALRIVAGESGAVYKRQPRGLRRRR